MADQSFGRALSAHRGTIGAGGWLWYIGGILVLAGIVNTVQGVRAMLGMADTGGASWVEVASMGLVSFAIAALLLIVPVLRWRQRLEIFEGGLVWTRLFGTRVVPRAEIAGAELIGHRSRLGHHVEVVVRLAGGGSLSISGLERPEEAANLALAISRRDATPTASAAAGPAPGGWRPPGAR
jgi:hypothetical protein